MKKINAVDTFSRTSNLEAPSNKESMLLTGLISQAKWATGNVLCLHTMCFVCKTLKKFESEYQIRRLLHLQSCHRGPEEKELFPFVVLTTQNILLKLVTFHYRRPAAANSLFHYNLVSHLFPLVII